MEKDTMVEVTPEDEALLSELLKVGEFWPGHEYAQRMRQVLARYRIQSEGRTRAGEALDGLEWTEDGYSLRTPYDGDVDGDGRHIVVGGEIVVTFADSEIGDEYRSRILAALSQSTAGEDGA